MSIGKNQHRGFSGQSCTGRELGSQMALTRSEVLGTPFSLSSLLWEARNQKGFLPPAGAILTQV